MESSFHVEQPGKVYFISAVCPPTGEASSTDIMTNNILAGIKKNHIHTILLAVCKPKDDQAAITEYYSSLVDEVILVKSMFPEEKPGRAAYLYQCFWKGCHLKAYSDVLGQLNLNLMSGDLVLANKVYSDEIMYGAALKKAFPKALYYQYWSDPMTLSGILPEALKHTPRRWPFWFIERKYLKFANHIIYGTKVLMQFQRRLYPKLASKMKYVDVSYTENNETVSGSYSTIPNSIVYSGNYFSNIRNIRPLLEAVGALPECHLDVYGSGDVLQPEAHNICMHGRISPDELCEIEKKYAVNVCILNHGCIQIPGKVFYHSNQPAPCLVIVDGPYADLIIEYLNDMGCYTICRNEKKDIVSALRQVLTAKSVDRSAEFLERYSSKRISMDLINGGLD